MAGQGRPRRRDHRERQPQRWQAGVREPRRPSRARVALGRARDGVGDRAREGLQERRPARDQHRSQQPQPRRPGRQRRRVRGVAQRGRRARGRTRRERRRHRLHRGQRRQRRRVPAQELPAARRLRGRQLRHLGRAGRAGRGPQPQLRHVLGRPRLGHEPAHPDLPRPRPVLRARVAQHQGPRVPQPGDDADHQPHDRRPGAARARPRGGRRPGRREPRLQGARRRDGEEQRLLQPEGLRALRHDRHDRGLELQRHRRLRLHVRDLLRDAELRRPATATTRPSTRASRRPRTSGPATTRRPTTRSPAPRTPASTARATARRTTSPPRARSTSSATACSRAPRPPARRCG